MFYQSKKTIQWKGKDYARTVMLFVLHTAVLILLFGIAAFASTGWDPAETLNRVFYGDRLEKTLYVLIPVSFIAVGTYLYFYNEYRDFLLKSGNINLTFVIVELSIVLMFVVGRYLHSYARPFALCSLLVLLLINRRTAIFMNTVICLLMFMLDSFLAGSFTGITENYSALVVGYTTSLLAIYLVYGLRSRLKVFLMGFVIAIPVSVCSVALEFENFIQNPLTYLIYGFTSGMLSVVLMMVLLPFFEKVFAVVTDYRLAELTDHKSTLIKLLITQAPGTFNHSLVVSTLAESCANAIGENALLARACAYYHDIGKLKHPQFFTENQKGGYNPHDELSPELSTDIIRSHAKDGYDLIKKYHLPQILADVAIQHHGTLLIRYFYDKAQKFTDGDLDIAHFSYSGPKPQTKIAAIIMIADGAEAKVRTLSDRSHRKVDDAVSEIIEERMNFDQFSECELTMKDIDIIRATITNALAGVYHDRVEYPKLKIGRVRSGENK
ncbi:MAG: HDIG domain-containing protein [Clostridia bacterium]|nr:HDIG domain-containing protein [Clostridia bacterium]